MRRAINIAGELNQVHTVEDLTEVFESIASIRISKIRDRVVASKDFFAELWQTYSGLRIDRKERLKNAGNKNGKDVFLVVTGEGNLSGEADEKIVSTMMEAYGKAQNTDVVVVGSHGYAQLKQRTIPVAKAFSMPTSDVSFSVTDIIATLAEYNRISVFYQTYDSLRVQKVSRIELLATVKNLGEDVTDETGVEVVSSRDYIFEPGVEEIADYLESVMMGVALIQVIMESKLSQYAARFNAMNAAKHRANELVTDFNLQYHRAKRGEADERLKEIIKIVKHHQKGLA
jgi:F-type H+-transporting ATPase subunit gamma